MWLQNKLKKGLASLLTWKNNVRRFALSVIISITILNFMMPYVAEAQELEGEAYAPSGSSFDTQTNLWSNQKDVEVCYFNCGGIPNVRNRTRYEVHTGEQILYAPYRQGYRFAGWYTDRGRHKRVKYISTDSPRTYILYAKWTPQINNRENVLNYNYRTKSSDKSTILLKDLDFSFYDSIDIPGMPDTRQDDLLNQYIFSESQCPQGVCFTDDFVLITSYSTEDDCMGELMVMDRETGQYMITLGMDENSHLGGIAFDGDNVWVCNSYENAIERISYDFIKNMAYQNVGEVVDARDVVDQYSVKNTPSCITYYGGRLWIATHTLFMNSKMVAYHFDSSKDKLVALSEYKIPSKVQGVAFDDSGAVYLSSSYGRNRSSYIYNYTSVTSLATRPNHPARTIEMPPCSEEIDIDEDNLYVLFDSAGEKYLEGTDGKGQSLSPIDKLLIIPLKDS